MKKIFMAIALCLMCATTFTSCHIKTDEERYKEKCIRDSIELERQYYIDSCVQASVDSLKSVAEKNYYTGNDEIYHDSIKIEKAWLSSKNSCGGFEVHIGYRNLAHKTIKYATFNGDFYNAVDDIIESEYEESFHGKDTGPIKYNKTNGDYYNSYWGLYYGWQIKYLKIYSIKIEYMDGTIVTVPYEYTTKKIN